MCHLSYQQEYHHIVYQTHVCYQSDIDQSSSHQHSRVTPEQVPTHYLVLTAALWNIYGYNKLGEAVLDAMFMQARSNQLTSTTPIRNDVCRTNGDQPNNRCPGVWFLKLWPPFSSLLLKRTIHFWTGGEVKSCHDDVHDNSRFVAVETRWSHK